MDPFIASVLGACREIHEQLIQNKPVSLFDSYTVGHGGDVSSGFDLLAESICVKHLKSYGKILSEESGWIDTGLSDEIIIDPIDGSDNFASFFPYFGVAVVRRSNGTVTDGVVCNLANGDFFVRTKHEYYKSTLFDPFQKLPILNNNFAKVGLFEKAPNHPELIRELIAEGFKFRSPGALALSLAYAPYVKYVLFLGTMRSYDIEAGLYLNRELFTFHNDSYLLISKDKDVFMRIQAIVEKECF